MTPRVVFDRVWKKFRRGERHDSLRDLLPAATRRLFRRLPPRELSAEEFWALRDISFEVKPGEALGIIGPNGAGKSTTLKLLTKFLRPTQGRAEVRGRAGALIDVAAGFHPDLTGRENVFLQGSIMGLKRRETRARFDEIVASSGIGDFIDTPVKRYSSGMNARLGFAIAAHLDPDVLIIDEVLSVGDRAFQQRCVERMRHFVETGCAIVFVSHHLDSILRLCGEAMLLDHECLSLGPAAQTVRRYVEGGLTPSTSLEADLIGQLNDNRGVLADVISPGTPLVLSFEIGANRDLPGTLVSGLVCARATDQLCVYDVNFELRHHGFTGVRAGERVRFETRLTANLLRGTYHLSLHLYDPSRAAFVGRMRPLPFSIEEQRSYAGVADLAAVLEGTRLHGREPASDRP
jgi:lipopolysaccharide transport system ATP-binding protein